MALLKQFRPLKHITIYVMIGLGVMAFCDLLSIVTGVGQIVSPDSSIDLDEDGAMSTWLMIQGLIYLLKFPIYITTAVLFLVWLHRAHTNLEALEARNLQFTPGWAVGWWFVPFANLVKPFQVVREVWWDSDPNIETERVFLSESLRSAPVYMGVWWATWLLSNIAANITARVYEPDTMSNVEVGGVLFMITGTLSVIAAVLAIMVVRDITGRQEARFAEISRRGASTSDLPPPPPVFDRDL